MLHSLVGERQKVDFDMLWILGWRADSIYLRSDLDLINHIPYNKHAQGRPRMKFDGSCELSARFLRFIRQRKHNVLILTDLSSSMSIIEHQKYFSNVEDIIG